MPRIGETARRTRTVSRRDVELFGELTGDRTQAPLAPPARGAWRSDANADPLRYDEDSAARSRFGGIIVHVDWSFQAPVHPGDEITAEVEVLETREDKPITRLRTTIVDQDGVVVLDGTALVWTEPL